MRSQENWLGLVAMGMYRDVRTKSISIGAENEDLPTISNLLKGVTDFISTNNFKIDLKKTKQCSLSHNT